MQWTRLSGVAEATETRCESNTRRDYEDDSSHSAAEREKRRFLCFARGCVRNRIQSGKVKTVQELWRNCFVLAVMGMSPQPARHPSSYFFGM
jgi:hypothetical protein